MDLSTDDLDPGSAISVDWTADRYHSEREWISRSQLLELRHRPAAFYLRHVAGLLPPIKSTPALEFGTALHLAVLEPRAFGSRVFIPSGRKDIDVWGRRRRRDSITVSQDDYDAIVAISASVLGHPIVETLFASGGPREQTVLWKHPGSEACPPTPIRVRADLLAEIDDVVVVADLKTTRDPSPEAFRRAIAKHDYHFQAALYRDAVAALYPDREVHFMLIAVAKDPPFEVGCYDLASEAITLGRNQYEATLVDLWNRRETQDWFAPWQRGATTLNLPGWAYYSR